MGIRAPFPIPKPQGGGGFARQPALTLNTSLTFLRTKKNLPQFETGKIWGEIL